ncbi:MAG: hypothetical protein L3V56_02035 [Candidatus Magnetoovum sp. WYHC-5]|nr:hypothetical protein [Candidatus Magnetoovum sp. WYHC-5]
MKGKKKVSEKERLAYEAYVDGFQRLEINKDAKIKCWEFMKCNPNVYVHCPAFLKSAGRRCWLVAGSVESSMFRCKVSGQDRNCKECEFYKKVKRGEL